MECPFKEFAGINERLRAIEKEIARMREQIAQRPDIAQRTPPESMKQTVKEYTLTVEQAAQITGYKPNYIYQLIREKALPYMKVRGKVRFDRRALTE